MFFRSGTNPKPNHTDERLDLVFSGVFSSSNHNTYTIMKIQITNKLGLPEALVQAVANDPYNPGDKSDYTITGLIKPARMSQLEKSESAVITIDVTERFHALQGQIVHGILERAGKALRDKGCIVEQRYYATYQVDGKSYCVSAQIDIFDTKTGTLSDYKWTTVGAAKHGLKKDHHYQVNFQAELVRRAGFRVTQAEVVLLFKDWSAERIYEGYPSIPSQKQNVDLMSSTQVDDWVLERIKDHVSAQSNLPLCTAEERWNRPTYAVMKDKEAKRAMNGGVHDTREAAEAFAQEKGGMVVERSGEDVRCLRYCPARFVCEQAKKNNPELAILADAALEGMVKVS